jgi:hypothetical protein
MAAQVTQDGAEIKTGISRLSFSLPASPLPSPLQTATPSTS